MYFANVCLDKDDLFKELFQVQLSHLFIIFPYSPWIAIVGKMVNVISTFCWNYMNLFIMIISAGLSTRFKQINEDLQRIKGEVKKSPVKLIRIVRISFESNSINCEIIRIFLAYVRRFLGITSNAISEIGRAMCDG